MKLQVHSLSFKNDSDQYLDIEVCNDEGYVSIIVDSQREFGIETVDELDQIYNKIKELLEEVQHGKEVN